MSHTVVLGRLVCLIQCIGELYSVSHAEYTSRSHVGWRRKE